jgi:hypothetical protein
MIRFLLRACVLATTFAASAGLSLAEDRATGGGITRLIDAQLSKRTSSGELTGCEVTYNVGYEDRIYRNGGMVLLRGSVSINRTMQEMETLPLSF